jgi:epoxyqueuosine reductase
LIVTDSVSSTPTQPAQKPRHELSDEKLTALASKIHTWAAEAGFQECGIVDPDLEKDANQLHKWLEKQYHGEMNYLAANTDKRRDPYLLVPGSCRIISVRMDYTPPAFSSLKVLKSPEKAYIARYTLGRDYHKMMRKRLPQLGKRLADAAGNMGYRAFVDSAPVMERPIAQQAGIGWTGKHTLILNRHAGSWFFLGELFIDLPLPTDPPIEKQHCGSCTACLDICPTKGFIGPYELDATRCISFLTIEKKGAIPEELRPLMGNRIFGCDDCQLVCPWNRFAKHTAESDFHPRHQLDDVSLIDLFNWNETAFLKRTEGSAIRRTGYDGWLRNIAVALGNSGGGKEVIDALEAKRPHCSEMVTEHIDWAIKRLSNGETLLSPIQLK